MGNCRGSIFLTSVVTRKCCSVLESTENIRNFKAEYWSDRKHLIVIHSNSSHGSRTFEPRATAVKSLYIFQLNIYLRRISNYKWVPFPLPGIGL